MADQKIRHCGFTNLTTTHGVILYLFAQPEFSPTAIKIKQPSSILRHPSALALPPPAPSH